MKVLKIVIELRSDSEIPADNLENAVRQAIASVCPSLSDVKVYSEKTDRTIPPHLTDEELLEELPQLSYDKIF